MKKILLIVCILLTPNISLAGEWLYREIDTQWGISKKEVKEFEEIRNDSIYINDKKNVLEYRLNNDLHDTSLFYHFDDNGMSTVSYIEFLDQKEIPERYDNMMIEAKSLLGNPIVVEEKYTSFILDEYTVLTIMNSLDPPFVATGLGPLKNDQNQEDKQEYTEMDLLDFTLDFNQLVGKKIKVSGVGIYMAETLQLSKKLFDGNSIFIEMGKLPRNQRKFILTKCPDSCNMVVYGVASDVSGFNGIDAHKIE